MCGFVTDFAHSLSSLRGLGYEPLDSSKCRFVSVRQSGAPSNSSPTVTTTTNDRDPAGAISGASISAKIAECTSRVLDMNSLTMRLNPSYGLTAPAAIDRHMTCLSPYWVPRVDVDSLVPLLTLPPVHISHLTADLYPATPVMHPRFTPTPLDGVWVRPSFSTSDKRQPRPQGNSSQHGYSRGSVSADPYPAPLCDKPKSQWYAPTASTASADPPLVVHLATRDSRDHHRPVKADRRQASRRSPCHDQAYPAWLAEIYAFAAGDTRGCRVAVCPDRSFLPYSCRCLFCDVAQRTH